MWYNCPYLKRQVELTDERCEHIISRHPDVKPFLDFLGEVIEFPDEIRTSQRDPETLIFYRLYRELLDGKSFAVVVKIDRRAFVLSAYLTRTRVNGEILWARE